MLVSARGRDDCADLLCDLVLQDATYDWPLLLCSGPALVDAGQRLMRSFGKLPNQHNLLRRSRLLSVRCGLTPRCSDGEMASAMWSLLDAVSSDQDAEPISSIDPEEPLHAAPENENPPRRWARGVLRPRGGSVVSMPVPDVSLQVCFFKACCLFLV